MTRSIVQRGLYFDELETGVVYEHRPRRTVSEADNILFTTLTMNTQALHLDAIWSEGTEFGERLVNSMFTLSTLVGLSVAQLTQGTIVANLGICLAAMNRRVLLIDGDVRKPTLHKMFNLLNRAGWSDLLEQEIDIHIPPAGVPQPTKYPGLFVLPAGQRMRSVDSL